MNIKNIIFLIKFILGNFRCALNIGNNRITHVYTDSIVNFEDMEVFKIAIESMTHRSPGKYSFFIHFRPLSISNIHSVNIRKKDTIFIIFQKYDLSVSQSSVHEIVLAGHHQACTASVKFVGLGCRFFIPVITKLIRRDEYDRKERHTYNTYINPTFIFGFRT